MGWRAARVEFSRVLALQEALGVPEPLAWTLVRRGLGDPEAAAEFMRADGPLDPPEALPGVADAADRLVLALERGERVAVHGDYDCDGVCSTAVLTRSLRSAGGDVVTFLPSRFTDGYGVRPETVDVLAGRGVRLLVCVDCGTTAVDALERAVEHGMDTIVLDHHLAAGIRPPGIIANPALGVPSDDPPAAVGVVFMVVRALADRLGPRLLGPSPDDEVDLVALATVADAVPLVGQNRRLVARGLAAMRRAPRPGIQALCRAAGIDPRTLDARHLGFSLGPSVNAAGRLTHADEALQLMLATDVEAALPLARRLWDLNTERRDVERRITDEAVMQVEAMPDELRDADAIVVSGEGWHEGVVGIVASRLVDRFERPAIVISRDGDVAKGSGRSLPGVDLHDLVGRADATLTRWGGHAGAVGLQLASADVATFRDQLLEAAAGIRGVIARARIRPVDAVVGARDLTLENAEALQALAPYGRGNPAVRLLMPGCRTEAVGTVGQGRHLSLRLVCGGAHARAVGFAQGHRASRIADGDRFDAHVSLGVERYQDLTGAKVVMERLERVTAGTPVAGACAPACDAACTARRGIADVRDMVLAGGAPDGPAAPEPAAPPLSVSDHRDTGTAMARIAALAGADGGVAVVVADVPRRRAVLDDVLAAGRLGLEAAVLAGTRCAAGALAARARAADGRPALMLVDHDSLPHTPIPDDMHLLVLDPPRSPGETAWIRAAAAGRHLHLAWGVEEAGLAEIQIEDRLALRPHAAAVWRTLRDGVARAWDADLEQALLGTEGALRDPRAVADALVALAEIGMVLVGPEGVRAAPDAPPRPLDEAPRARRAAERLEAARAYLALAPTLDPVAADYAAA